MALTDAQRAVLAALAPNRSPESVFAGGATLDAVAAARDLFATLPLDHAGLLYVDAAGHPCLPDPAGVASGHLSLREARPGGG